mgnify:CR=1 FL=1
MVTRATAQPARDSQTGNPLATTLLTAAVCGLPYTELCYARQQRPYLTRQRPASTCAPAPLRRRRCAVLPCPPPRGLARPLRYAYARRTAGPRVAAVLYTCTKLMVSARAQRVVGNQGFLALGVCTVVGPEGAWRVYVCVCVCLGHGRWARLSSGARCRYFASFVLSVRTPSSLATLYLCVATRRFGLALPTPHEGRSSLQVPSPAAEMGVLTECNTTQCMKTHMSSCTAHRSRG